MQNIVILKITLDNINPLIWRRIAVRSSITFWELHNTLQIAFGWENCHLFQFMAEGYFIGLPDPEFEEGSKHKTLAAKEITLDKIITEAGYQFAYEYDFGDSWLHNIKVEKLLPADPDTFYPLCMNGERAAPPEDCGGYPGYMMLMQSKGRKKYPEYGQMGGGTKKFKPEEFDLEKVNKQLKGIKG